MSLAFKVRLSVFTTKRLDKLFKSSSLTKTDLIVEDLGSVFASRLDRNVTYLIDAQFESWIFSTTTKPEGSGGAPST